MIMVSLAFLMLALCIINLISNNKRLIIVPMSVYLPTCLCLQGAQRVLYNDSTVDPVRYALFVLVSSLLMVTALILMYLSFKKIMKS